MMIPKSIFSRQLFSKYGTSLPPLLNRSLRRYVSNDSSSINSPVVIVGGGPTGLLLSILLSQYNVTHTLIEKRTPKQIHSHPQAHYLNLRTMEILKHYVPNAYDNVIKSMPPVEEWEGFTFGSSVLGRQIARVVHPVGGQGIRNGQDGNGSLVEDNIAAIDDTQSNGSIGQRCSICDPGHLAQNKFSSILLDEARRMLEVQGRHNGLSDSASCILHGESLNSIEERQGRQYPLQIKTDQREINASYIIAADGSHSRIRQQFGGENIMLGNSEMQNLINVHFKTSPSASKQLMERNKTVGMLHFVFNSKVVGAFVCHDLAEGEWVLQIPYFPPFQEAIDFSTSRAQDLVAAGLGLENEADVKVLSVRPWKMSAQVAKSFHVGSSKRIILAGDAAHTFPPAGGFGMNTGLQDAHNLAWRLANAVRQDQSSQSGIHLGHNDILQPYEKERRPIAAQNASLSVRNYNRTLEIAKACYLNADHPSLLKKVMDLPPMSFVPMPIRQQSFNAAVSVAMTPLINLTRRGNLYGENIVKNVRKILKSGGGLPLLFPRYEIGFSYDCHDELDSGDDTAGFYPEIAVGKRLPHCILEIFSLKDNFENTEETISLTDIESQVQERWNYPLGPQFSVIILSPYFSSAVHSAASKWAHDIQNDFPSRVIEIYSSRLDAVNRRKTMNSNAGVFFDKELNFSNLVHSFHEKNGPCDSNGDDDGSKKVFYALLVRPDGHITAFRHFVDNE